MRKEIKITKKQHRILVDNLHDIQYHLNDGFCMSLEDIEPIRNCFGWINSYKVYVDVEYSSQKDVINAFKRIGII